MRGRRGDKEGRCAMYMGTMNCFHSGEAVVLLRGSHPTWASVAFLSVNRRRDLISTNHKRHRLSYLLPQ